MSTIEIAYSILNRLALFTLSPFNFCKYKACAGRRTTNSTGQLEEMSCAILPERQKVPARRQVAAM